MSYRMRNNVKQLFILKFVLRFSFPQPHIPHFGVKRYPLAVFLILLLLMSEE